eukprot:409895-Amphidinium_carterae.1
MWQNACGALSSAGAKACVNLHQSSRVTKALQPMHNSRMQENARATKVPLRSDRATVILVMLCLVCEFCIERHLPFNVVMAAEVRSLVSPPL